MINYIKLLDLYIFYFQKYLCSEYNMLVIGVNISKLYNTCIKINMYFIKANNIKNVVFILIMISLHFNYIYIYIYIYNSNKSVKKYFNNILTFRKFM